MRVIVVVRVIVVLVVVFGVSVLVFGVLVLVLVIVMLVRVGVLGAVLVRVAVRVLLFHGVLQKRVTDGAAIQRRCNADPFTRLAQTADALAERVADFSRLGGNERRRSGR
jgi:hypothetical protein